MAEAASADELKSILTRLLQDVCGTRQPIGPNERLREYGLSSRLAAGFIAQLSEQLDRSLPQTLVWDHPTIDRIAAYLRGEDTAAPASAQRALSPDDAVAIVGLACRFPGADGPDAFWQLLTQEGEAVDEVPTDRWDIDAFYDADPEMPGRMSTRRGGFLRDVAGFDAGFFGISPREALAMDPQQRIALELAQEAIGRAGLRPSSLEGSRTGVFMGAMWSEYGDLFDGVADIGQFSATGRDIGIIANRISYAFGLNGPSLTVDTACSASLVAVHLALRSIRSGESRIALAGGVNLLLTPDSTVAMTKFGGMAPDGRSKAFDARADGYVRGEGAGIAVLMPLSDALAAGLTPLALIRGSAVNNDGPSNGLTAPNPDAQVSLIHDALSDAQLTGSDVDFVEAHGTGTQLGDPIELGGIGKVYGTAEGRETALPVGSVKTNIGHLEAAAGMAGMIKATLSLGHQMLPATLHQQQGNPLIDFDGLNLRVPKTSEPLSLPADRPLRAGVSSFGFGGTNAHIVLEAWSPPTLPTPPAPQKSANKSRNLVFVYSGNGGAWPGMGSDLLGNPVFDAGIAPLCAPYQDIAGLGLRSALADPHRATGLAPNVEAQLLTFAVQAGITRVFADQGLNPSAVCGHSLGDISAGYAAGIFDAQDATRIVFHRSVLQAQVAQQGAMALVKTAAGDVAGIPGIAVSGQNDRDHITISGPVSAIEAAIDQLNKDGIEAIRIAVDIAFHSPAMDPLAEQLVQELAGLTPLPGRIPFYSTVTGGVINGNYVTAKYLGRNLRDPVQFSQTISEIATTHNEACYIEIGPHPLLLRGLRADLGGDPDLVIGSLQRAQNGPQMLAQACEAMRASGVHIKPPQQSGPHLFALSAKSETGLTDWATRIADSLEDDAADIGDLTRAAFAAEQQPRRAVFVAGSTSELRTQLRAWAKAPPADLALIAQMPAMMRAGDVDLSGLDAWRFADRRIDEIATKIEQTQGYSLIESAVQACPPAVKSAFVARVLSEWGVLCDLIPASGQTPVTTSAAVEIGYHHFVLPNAPVQLALMHVLAEIWCHGIQVDWQRFDMAYSRKHCTLPSYPFQHRRYWPDKKPDTADLVYEVAFEPRPAVPVPSKILGTLPSMTIPDGTGLDILAGNFARGALVHFEIDQGNRWHKALSRLALQAGDVPEIDQSLSIEQELITNVGSALPQILSGQLDPLSVLFPDGDSDLLTGLYATAPFGRGIGDWVESTTRSLIDAGASRVIEVGAGTGATTTRITPYLPAHGAYQFTDVSPMFLAAAHQKFDGTPGFSATLFDADRPPNEQGIEGGYDLVLAVNALHATQDIETSLRHMRALLRPGGHLLLGEVTGAPGWLDLVFGTLDGWWRFDDKWRENTALLTPDQWQAVLAKTGFDVAPTREDGDRQSVILARASAAPRRYLILGAGSETSLVYKTLQDAGHTTTIADNALPQEGEFDETWVLAAPQDHAAISRLGEDLCAQARFGTLRTVSVGDAVPIQQEMLRAYLRSTQTIDADRLAAAVQMARATDAHEVALTDPTDDMVRLDGKIQEAGRLKPVPEFDAQGDKGLKLRNDGYYLITGGFGDLGQQWIRFLVGRGAKHIAVLSRQSNGENAKALVTQLAKTGVQLSVHKADVTDVLAVKRAVDALDPPLAGVIHAAGQFTADLSQAAGPKVDGARALDVATQDLELDVMLLVSSAAGTWGAPGWAGYAAANAALDTFAAARNRTGKRTVSVGFGRFSQRGLLPRDEDQRLAAIGMRAMPPQAALAAAWAQTSGGRSHVVVADIDWPVFRTALEGQKPRALFRNMPRAQASVPLTRPALIRSKISASDISDPAQTIRVLLAESLGHENPEDVREDLGFFEQGLDSLSAVRLALALSTHFDTKITAATLFSYPTLPDLTRHLTAQSKDPVTAVHRAAALAGNEPIAIIGVSARYPGGINSYDDLKQVIFEGIDAVGEVPDDRWNWDAQTVSQDDLKTIQSGGYLDDVDLFDAAFFGITPTEATYMDPQQRLLLEAAWRALEHGGADPAAQSGARTGVFVGLTGSDYAEMARALGPDRLVAQAIMGLPGNTAAGRIAHNLGLRGPAVVTDTACSSSLTAVHLACQAIASGDCDTALAGGVNLILSPTTSLILARAGMLSPTGRCRSFGAQADGFVRAEGCGMVLLKRLSQAKVDGDPILSVIRSSAMNHDGRSSALTAPNGNAQQDVIREAHRKAGVDAAEFGYVELHGTGTPLGDPVEAEALTAVFGADRQVPLPVGSFKTNIGHAESAAGIGGLIRAAASLQDRKVPASLHSGLINPLIALDQFDVPQATKPFAPNARFAGVSSFGASGTNVHVVLEAAPLHEIKQRPRPLAVFKPKRFWIDQAPVQSNEPNVDKIASYHVAWRQIDLPDTPVLGVWQVIGAGAIECVQALRQAGMDATTQAAQADRVLVLPPSPSITANLDALAGWLEDLNELMATATGPVHVLSRRGVSPLNTENDDTVTVSGASVVALGRVLALKFPELWGGVLDVSDPVTLCADQIVRALSVMPKESEAALRGGTLYLPRLTKADAMGSSPETTPEPMGTALVTGAFGGLGQIAVRVLFAQGARHFALVSRHPDPALFADLKAQGATITALAVDVSDDTALRAALGTIDVSMPDIDQVLHLAGLREGSWTQMLATKVGGAKTLAGLSADWPLRRFLVAGSGAAVWGGVDLPAYAAANGALDGVVFKVRARGIPASTLAFGPMAETGMVDGDNSDLFDRIGLAPMDAKAAIEQALLWADAGQDAAIAQIDWSRFLIAHELRRPRPMLSDFRKDAEPKQSFDDLPDEDVLRAFLLQSVSDLLDKPVKQISPDEGFVSLGLDSFSLMDLRRLVESQFALTVPATALFDAPSVSKLAKFLSHDVPSHPSVSAPPAAARVPQDDAIAIIGCGMRMPGGVSDLAGLAAFLHAGSDGVGLPPPSRRAATRPQSQHAQVAGWLDDVEHFDAAHFRISPREAMQMDPQHRLLLQVASETLTAAGKTPDEVAGQEIGVFLGITGTEYGDVLRSHDILDAHSVSGRYLNAAAGRISHVLGITGPSLVVDTACSSSAVAVHMAIQSLLHSECEMALAGGANLLLSDETTQILRGAGMLSPDGRCHSFDAAANGYVRAEGVGLVLLKRLSAAQAAGDEVLAVLRGSAMNHDGASSGFTVPNGVAQKKVITAALANAGIEAKNIGYVEAHGTGTPLGDPIEAQALSDIYATQGQALEVGTIKSNIGHAEAAAGIAGLLKLVASAKNSLLPGNLHFNQINPHIAPLAEQIKVVAQPTPWATRDGRRLAGLSSFGASGTNVHLIVEAMVPKVGGVVQSATVDPTVWAFSAEHKAGLRHKAADGTLDASPGSAPFRIAVAACDAAEAKTKLQAAPIVRAGQPKIAFMFTGQGAQVSGMGGWLYEKHAVFREQIDRIAACVDPILGQSLQALVCDPKQSLTGTDLAQPALFAFELALAELWRARGVVPGAVLGHSLGEISAAAFAGLLPLEEAAVFTVLRGRAMAASPAGKMAAVLADEDIVREVIGTTLDIAALNGPNNTVISGTEHAISAALNRFDRLDIPTRELAVSSAFHSELMEGILPALNNAVAGLRAQEGQLPLYRNKDGHPCRSITREDWVAQVRAPVRFADALSHAAHDGFDHFVEIGPRGVLTSMCRAVASNARFTAGFSVEGPALSLARAAADLWQNGVDAALGDDLPKTLQTGARTRFWPDLVAAKNAAKKLDCGRRFGLGTTSPSYTGKIADLHTGPETWPELEPSGYLGHVGVQLGLMTPPDQDADARATLCDAQFLTPLTFEKPSLLQRHTHPDGTVSLHLQRDGTDWRKISQFKMLEAAGDFTSVWHDQRQPNLDVGAHYERLARQGLQLGPDLRCIRALQHANKAVVAQIITPRVDIDQVFGLSVTLYEALAQVAAVLFDDTGTAHMVAGWDALHRTDMPLAGPLSIHAKRTGPATVQATLYGEGNSVLVHVDQMTLLPVAPVARMPWMGKVVWTQSPFMRSADPEQAACLIINIGSRASQLTQGLGARVGSTPGSPAVIAYGPTPTDANPLLELIERLTHLPRNTRGVLAALSDHVGPLRGLLNTFAMERADVFLRLCEIGMDVDPATAIAAELENLQGAEITRWDSNTRSVPRLMPLKADLPDQSVVVEARDGAIAVVPFESDTTKTLGAMEIEIEVLVAGINYRDVIMAQALGAAQGTGLGAECSGRVLRIGTAVNGLKQGDFIAAYVPNGAGALRSSITLDAAFVRMLPDGVSTSLGGAGLVAAMVARRALIELGDFRAGQCIFIHQAGSATGLACLGLAKNLGAAVVASAHKDKHAALLALGINKVINSREAFEEGVEGLAIEGPIDLAIGAFGLQRDTVRDCLGAQTRIVDLTMDPSDTESVDLDRMAIRDPKGFAHLMDQALQDLAAQDCVLPVDVISPHEAISAFEVLQQGYVIGRKAVGFGLVPARWRSALITGANGGVGRALAVHLAQAGVARLHLLDIEPIAPEVLDALSELPVQVTSHVVDVTDMAVMQMVVDDARPEAILHTAAATRDQPLDQITAEALHTSFDAKCEGARVLDQLSRHPRVAAFVVFSSVTTHLPSVGQGAYAAANAALEQIAQTRRNAGYHASVLAWGPWDVGIGARISDRSVDVWRRYGIAPMPLSAALKAFDFWADRSDDIVILDVDWPRYARAQKPIDLLASLNLKSFSVKDQQDAPKRAGDDMPTAVREVLIGVLGLPSTSELPPATAFSDLGLDSLLAGEFSDALGAALGMSMSPTLAYNYPNLDALCRHLEGRMGSSIAQDADTAPVAPEQEDPVVPDDEISDLEKRLLDAERYLAGEK